MANQNSQLEFLKENIEERINRIDGARIDYKNKAFAAFISSTVLSAITTILLGLRIDDSPGKDIVRITALILTTTVTVIGAYNSFYSHKELWIANNIAKTKFLQLKFNILYDEQGAAPILEKDIDAYKKTYQDILNELNGTWQKNRLNQKA